MNKNMKLMLLLLIGLLGIGLVGGCGYGFRGTVNNLPPDIKRFISRFLSTIPPKGGPKSFLPTPLIYEFTRGGGHRSGFGSQRAGDHQRKD